jgi:hypothetical protein
MSALSVGVGLAVRVAHRGPYSPGWDFLGTAQGLYWISTRTPSEILSLYVANFYQMNFTVWSLSGAPVVLLPGALTALHPWEYWTHVVAFVLFLVSLALVRVALALPWAETWLILLAWGASSALLSWSLTGLAYATNFLPHALALVIVLRLSRRPIATALLCVVTHLLSWQVQELGQTVFIVLFAAVLLLDGSRACRLMWLLTGAWQLWTTVMHPTQERFRHVPWLGIAGTAERLRALAWHLIDPGVDALPFLVLALVCVLLVRRHRWFWRVLFGAQVALLVALALTNLDFVWPRRFLLVGSYGLVAIIALGHELGERGRGLLAAALLAANVWQVGSVVRWSRIPLQAQGAAGFTLPSTRSTVDYRVVFGIVDWYHQLRTDLDQGKNIFLLYNHLSYPENATDPAAIPERLYLTLGHEAFAERVVMFGETRRWNGLPIRPFEQLPITLARMGDGSGWVLYRVGSPFDPLAFRNEMARIREQLDSAFDVEWTPWGDASLSVSIVIERGTIIRRVERPRSALFPPD